MANIRTFDYTGDVQTWTVPSNIAGTTVTVELWGAVGGDAHDGSHSGGRGGRVIGELTVAPGDVLHVNVGGQGKKAKHALGSSTSGKGGWNGGGDGGSSGLRNGSGGGGSTDIRINSNAIGARVAVAGAGGGASPSHAGGDGGGLTGADAAGATGGHGGDQAGGGAHGTHGSGPDSTGHDGGLGTGGDGAAGSSGFSAYEGSSGGGAGLYGGGGGSLDSTGVVIIGAGGGGSSFIGALGGSITNVRGYSFADGDGRAFVGYDLLPDAPAVAEPDNGSNFDISLPITVGWSFSDPDPGDVQVSADVRWRVGSGAWNTVTGASTDATETYQFSGGDFAGHAGHTIEWQVRTADAFGPGPWSASSYFGVFNAPAAPTLTTDDQINDFNQPVTVVGVSGFAQVEVRVLGDAAGSPVLTPVLADKVRDNTDDDTMTLNAPTYFNFINGDDYHIQARVSKPDGVWSDWTDSGPLLSNINKPLQPMLALTGLPDIGAVLVTINNPGSDPFPPVSNKLYRSDMLTGVETLIQDDLDVNSSYQDNTIGFNRPFRYRVEAYTSVGAFTSSD